MNVWDLLKFVFGLLWKQMLQMLLITLTLLYFALTYINLLVIVLVILFWNLTFKLWREIEYREVPSLKGWFKSIVLNITITIFFYYFILFLGGYGLLGLSIILLAFAVLRIWQNWKLYDAVTTWGAERITGRSDKSFNIEEVLKDGESK